MPGSVVAQDGGALEGKLTERGTAERKAASVRGGPGPAWPAGIGQKVKSFHASGSKAGGGGCQEAGRCVPGMRRLKTHLFFKASPNTGKDAKDSSASLDRSPMSVEEAERSK